MQLGMIGLGRMGANLVRRLMRGGHECVVYDVNPAAVKELAGEGATGASSLEEFVAKLTAPGAGSVERTPGRDGKHSTSENGYLHCGPNGAGHFVKMVHNGIEYGIMAAYAEGLDVLRNADVGNRKEVSDAETTPLRDPDYYRYDIDTTEVVEVWRRGSVVASWLLDLTAAALEADPELSG